MCFSLGGTKPKVSISVPTVRQQRIFLRRLGSFFLVFSDLSASGGLEQVYWAYGAGLVGKELLDCDLVGPWYRDFRSQTYWRQDFALR
jgi:hypothetical protein